MRNTIIENIKNEIRYKEGLFKRPPYEFNIRVSEYIMTALNRELVNILHTENSSLVKMEEVDDNPNFVGYKDGLVILNFIVEKDEYFRGYKIEY